MSKPEFLTVGGAPEGYDAALLIQEVERLGGFMPAAEAERKRKAREDADEERAKRYRPTLDQCKDAVVDEATSLCAYVFEKDPEGRPAPFISIRSCAFSDSEAAQRSAECRALLAAKVATFDASRVTGFIRNSLRLLLKYESIRVRLREQ